MTRCITITGGEVFLICDVVFICGLSANNEGRMNGTGIGGDGRKSGFMADKSVRLPREDSVL